METIGRRLPIFVLLAFAAGSISLFVLLVFFSGQDEPVSVTGEAPAPSVLEFTPAEQPLPSSSKGVAQKSSPPPEVNASEGELRPDPGTAKKPRVTKKPSLPPTGIVHGTLTLPNGKTVHQGRLSYNIRGGKSARSWTIPFWGGRFIFEPENAGVITLYGNIGKYWIVPMTLDFFDETTATKEVHVNLEYREKLRLPLVDGKGLPILLRHLSWSVDPFTELLTRPEGTAELSYQSEAKLWFQSYAISNGSITLPFRPRTPFGISISGPGIVKKDFDLSPGSCPDRLALDLLAPICRGCVQLPSGASWSDMYLFVECVMSIGTRTRTEEIPDLFDEETGAYAIYRDSEEPDGAPYSVTFTLEGYKPWVLENIKLEKTETLEGVNVSFEKEE